MTTIEELQNQIEAAIREGEGLDHEEAYWRNEVTAATERQRLRRELDRINAANDSKRAMIFARQYQRRGIDDDAFGPHRPDDSIMGAFVQPRRRKNYDLKRDGDVANCLYNVFKKEHIWRIEGMSWLKRALEQAGDDYATSSPINVGLEDDEETFHLLYSPYGVDAGFQFDGSQFGSLVLCHHGEGGTAFRYRLYIKRAGGEFVNWGGEGEECSPDGWYQDVFVYGPDVQYCPGHTGDTPLRPIGVCGLSHEELLESEWVENDTLTVKVQLEIRTCLPFQSLTYSDPTVDVSPPDLISNWRSLLNAGKYSDVTIVVEGERIHAHSLVLCMRSEVFDRLLNGGMRESIEKEVVVDECDPAIFKALLDFLYTDEFSSIETMMKDSTCTGLPNRPISLLQSVLAVSHRYQISRLQLWCEQQLCDCLSVDEVCQVLCQAHLFDAKQLEQACLKFIKTNLAEVVATPAYGRLGAEWPEVLLKINIAFAGIIDSRASATMDAFAAAQRKPGSEGAVHSLEDVCRTTSNPAEHEGGCSAHRRDRADGCHESFVEDVRRDSPIPQVVSPGIQQNNENVELNEGALWVQGRVLADWKDHHQGGEYLSLQKDDLVLVWPVLEDGWAFGRSISQGISGWFPPTFVSQ